MRRGCCTRTPATTSWAATTRTSIRTAESPTPTWGSHRERVPLRPLGRRAAGPRRLACWRYSGAQGEYSAHARTRLFSDTTGALLPTTLVNGELGFVVRRGQAVRAEFTYENNGRTTVTGAPVSYHVSTDDFISTADLRVATANLTLVRDAASTLNKALRIPTNLQVNRNYWLGSSSIRTARSPSRTAPTTPPTSRCAWCPDQKRGCPAPCRSHSQLIP